jgi:hypothetical protein
MHVFRRDNTEGYTHEQLAELNEQWSAQGAGLDPDSDEGKHTQECILADYDSADPSDLLRAGEEYYVVASHVRAALGEEDELRPLRESVDCDVSARGVEAQLFALGLGDQVVIQRRESDDAEVAFISRDAWEALARED